MALDPRYICSSDLEGIFRDKLTGLPMAAGKIYFYSDYNRQIPKAVYQLSGSPPFSFSALPNPLTLSGIGSYQDNGGNNIVIYYLPYVIDDDGNITDEQELYYVSVFNSDNVPQFTRNEWPPLASNLESSKGEGVRNYIPNGQFLAHNDHPITDTTTQTGIDILEVAQGGWSFKKTTGGSGVYTISFNDESNASLGALKDFPPYSINIQTSGVGSETVRDLVIQWPDVSRFSLDTDTDYNFLFAARSNNPSSIDLNLRLIMNYGDGGSAQEDTSIASKIVGPQSNGFQYFSQTITIPSTSGKTIEANSFIALVLRLPAATPINIRLTDFAFTLGSAALASFPITTNAQMLSQGVAGWMPTPNPDGSDLYLPLILTNKGMLFDHSLVGNIIATTLSTDNIADKPLLFMNGVSYRYTDYSALGIPYKRLADYLIENSPAVVISNAEIPAQTIPMFGTGANFVTLFNHTGVNADFFIGINSTSAGGSATQVSASITIAATAPNIYYTATVATVPAAGDHWTFTNGTSTIPPYPTNLVYNVWYSVDGAGSAPTTPTGANIEVKLVTGDTTAVTAAKTIETVNQYQFSVYNLAGLFLRALDPDGTYDPDTATRIIQGISLNNVPFTGNNLGSFEFDEFGEHNHPLSKGAGNVAGSGNGAALTATATFDQVLQIANDGGGETRPVNFDVNYYIRY